MNRLTEPRRPRYMHTQTGLLCLILYGSAAACTLLGWSIDDTQGMYVADGADALFALLAPAFHHLTVVDQGEVRSIGSGPGPLFRRTVRYPDVERVEVGRTLMLDGWGIHWSIRGGWVWNLWGRDCVVVRLKSGVVRIGTDDTNNLVRFLKEATKC